MERQKRKGLGQRGIALAQTGIVLVALVSMVAVGVDVGRIALTATEVQTLADLSATAGAKELIDPKTDAGTARSGADAVIVLNGVDGAEAAPDMVDVQTGIYNPSADPPFSESEDEAAINAVRAEGQANVTTLLAGIFGSSVENVTKDAIATLTGLGGGQANLPLAIGNCVFPPNSDCTEQACLPDDVELSDENEDNGAWTSFFINNASTEEMRGFFPSGCGNQAGGELSPPLLVGQDIEMQNGQVSNLLDLLQGCLDNGINEFFVPVIDCDDQGNQTSTILGFANIRVTEVVAQGQEQHIVLDTILDVTHSGPPGGGQFGNPVVALVK